MKESCYLGVSVELREVQGGPALCVFRHFVDIATQDQRNALEMAFKSCSVKTCPAIGVSALNRKRSA